MIRPEKDEYYLEIAAQVARRSTCLKSAYGAVIVNNDEIVSTGYNGAPRGEMNCCDIGSCLRKELNIPFGERYELCRSVHAEQNAIISASRKDMIGATLYLFKWKDGKPDYTAKPCALCERFIKNAGIESVVVYTEIQEDNISKRIPTEILLNVQQDCLQGRI